MTKRVYFYKNINNVLPNHKMSLSKDSHFHILDVGDITKSFCEKFQLFARQNFKFRAYVLEHPVDLETDVSLYRTYNLKTKTTFPPKPTFSCLRLRY